MQYIRPHIFSAKFHFVSGIHMKLIDISIQLEGTIFISISCHVMNLPFDYSMEKRNNKIQLSQHRRGNLFVDFIIIPEKRTFIETKLPMYICRSRETTKTR